MELTWYLYSLQVLLKTKFLEVLTWFSFYTNQATIVLLLHIFIFSLVTSISVCFRQNFFWWSGKRVELHYRKARIFDGVLTNFFIKFDRNLAFWWTFWRIWLHQKDSGGNWLFNRPIKIFDGNLEGLTVCQN